MLLLDAMRYEVQEKLRRQIQSRQRKVSIGRVIVQHDMKERDKETNKYSNCVNAANNLMCLGYK